MCFFTSYFSLPKKNSPHSPLLQWNLCFSLAFWALSRQVIPSRERKKISHQIGKERSSSQLHFLISLDGICYVSREGRYPLVPTFITPRFPKAPAKKKHVSASLGKKNTQAFQLFQPNYQWVETKQITNLVGGWTNPFEKYARQIGSFPQIGKNIKNVWNHHLEIDACCFV